MKGRVKVLRVDGRGFKEAWREIVQEEEEEGDPEDEGVYRRVLEKVPSEGLEELVLCWIPRGEGETVFGLPALKG